MNTQDAQTAQSTQSVQDNAPPTFVSKRILFCLVGSSFSPSFLSAWSETLLGLTKQGHRVFMSTRTDSTWYIRNNCLGGNVLRGKYQIPFDGKLEYDYVFMIHHDVVFSKEHIVRMLSRMDTTPSIQVLSGVVPVSDNVFDMIEKGHWRFEEFVKEGRFREFTRRDLVQKRDQLFEVDHASMDFVCIRKGVLESIEYPWFKPLYFEFAVDLTDSSGNTVKREIRDYCNDNVAMSRNLVEKGYSLWVDPLVTVAREQTATLTFPHREFIEQEQKAGTYEQTLENLAKENADKPSTD